MICYFVSNPYVVLLSVSGVQNILNYIHQKPESHTIA
jgi:hypothetical protein